MKVGDSIRIRNGGVKWGNSIFIQGRNVAEYISTMIAPLKIECLIDDIEGLYSLLAVVLYNIDKD